MRFWYTKFLMRFMFILALAGFGGVLYYAYETDMNYEPIGAVAPFKEDAPNFSQNTLVQIEDTGIRLENPHRSNKELQDWVTKTVSQSLYIPNKEFQNTLFQMDRYFTPDGFSQYQDYLSQSKVEQFIQKGGYSLGVLIEEPPIELTSNNVNDVYRWLYQVPITVSFIPEGTNSLTAGATQTVDQKLMLQVQIRRVNKPNNPYALKIEDWKMRLRR